MFCSSGTLPPPHRLQSSRRRHLANELPYAHHVFLKLHMQKTRKRKVMSSIFLSSCPSNPAMSKCPRVPTLAVFFIFFMPCSVRKNLSPTARSKLRFAVLSGKVLFGSTVHRKVASQQSSTSGVSRGFKGVFREGPEVLKRCCKGFKGVLTEV